MGQISIKLSRANRGNIVKRTTYNIANLRTPTQLRIFKQQLRECSNNANIDSRETAANLFTTTTEPTLGIKQTNRKEFNTWDLIVKLKKAQEQHKTA